MTIQTQSTLLKEKVSTHTHTHARVNLTIRKLI